ncbi:MAG: class II glutamine amidotransferase [Sulfobacillus sp.]
MCEMLALTSNQPLDMKQTLTWARLLEELGVASYGWGMAWVDDSGLHRYRSVLGLKYDQQAWDVLGQVATHRAFIHLRRPSLMSSQSHLNAQPYCDPEGTFAFAHNGFLSRHREYRPDFSDQLKGTSDSEVGYLYWLQQLSLGQPFAKSLVATHEALKGHANFMALSAQGQLAVYAGNHENPCYSFRIGSINLSTTGLHSLDDYLFDALFPQATNIKEISYGTAIELP